MKSIWSKLDSESKAAAEDLEKEGVNLEKIVTKLMKAKKKIKGTRLSDILETV